MKVAKGIPIFDEMKHVLFGEYNTPHLMRKQSAHTAKAWPKKRFTSAKQQHSLTSERHCVYDIPTSKQLATRFRTRPNSNTDRKRDIFAYRNLENFKMIPSLSRVVI